MSIYSGAEAAGGGSKSWAVLAGAAGRDDCWAGVAAGAKNRNAAPAGRCGARPEAEAAGGLCDTGAGAAEAERSADWALTSDSGFCAADNDGQA